MTFGWRAKAYRSSSRAVTAAEQALSSLTEPEAQVATTDLAVAHVAGLEAAVNAEDAVQKLPGFAAVTVAAFMSSMLAVPVATLALWRARLVAWWLPLVTAAAFLGPNILPGPAIGAFSLMAVGMLVVGWALWRIPVVAWYGTDPSDQLDAARTPGLDAG